MSSLKRPLLKNNFLSLTGSEPLLNNFSLYNHFPIGLIIISNVDPTSCNRNEEYNKNERAIDYEEVEIKIKYINQIASELFEIKENDSSSKIHEQFNLFKKFIKNQTVEQSLDNILFNKNRNNEFYGSFKGQGALIYVKYKINNEDLYICTDYYNDERKIIQSQLFQGLKFQYIATLFHELYNPINALLIMIDINNNEDENREEFTKSILCNQQHNISDIEESHFSVLTDNDYEKMNINMQEYEKYSIKKNQKLNELYRNKLKAMRDKEKDINVLINMIYIFLENLILYLRINLGININEKKEKNSERHKNDINPESSDNKNNNNNQYLTKIKKIKKLNLELSFQKYLKKFSYLFKFKNISFSTDFSYLSNKYILTDESIFFDFLGQIYSFLFHIIPKSQGFEITYSIINDNKIKILFQKISKTKKGYRHKKPRKSNLFILCEDKFKATSSVKTSDMNQEILYKLAEMLGIKLKIMEYEDQNQDIYLTLIIPYSLDDANDLLCSETDENPLEDIGKISNLAEVAKRNIIKNNDEEEIIHEDNYNISKNNNNIKTSDIINLKPIGILKSLSNIRNSKGYLNSNYSSALMADHIENIDERNSSEEDVSSRKAGKGKKENENHLIANKRNSNNMSYSSISKSSLHIPGVSILSNVQKMSNTPVSDKNFTCFQFKDLSTNYLNEVNPSFMQNDNNISKENIYKENINKLSLIHQKYSNLERLKKNGVEILIETENHNSNKNNNDNIYLDSISSCDNNTSCKDKKSLSVEADSDNFVEFENEDDFEEESPHVIKKNESNSIINNKNNHKNNSVLLNLNYTHNNGLSPKNEKYTLRNKSLFVANKRSNKTLNYNKKSNDSLFVIPEINENFQKNITKVTEFQRIDGSPPQNCNCKDILLVDDDEFILKTSKNILKAFKLEADCAENGQECLNMIKEKQEKNCNCSKSKYKIILMDITMPVMDGIEAAKNIQKLIDENKLYDTIKIIFISAHVNLDLSTILSGIKCAIDYYAKPISGVKYKSLLDKYYYS